MKQAWRTLTEIVMGSDWSGSRLDLLSDVMGQGETESDRLRSQGNYIPGSLQQAHCVSLGHFSICPGDHSP